MRALCIAIALAIAAPAYAEDKALARQSFAEGSKFYDLAQFDRALESFQKAYWNYEDPNILFNIAQCHRGLGHKREAIDQYRSYLRKAANPRNRTDVERIIGELQAQLDAEGQVKTDAAPTVVVATTPPPTAPEPKPVYKKAWFWGVVAGGVVAVGLGVGLGIGLTRSHTPHADGTVTF
jgi:tetratricopeptide (TPR) repeat protein